MEIAVSCCAGLFVMLGVLMAFPADGADRYGGRFARTPLPALCALARGIGRPLIGSRLLRTGVLARPLDLWREMAIGRVRLFERADDATLLGLTVLVCAVTGLIAVLVLHSPAGLPIGFALPAVLLAVLAGRRARKEASRLEEAMPEAFGSLAISLGSGHSLAQAMRYVGSHADEPIHSEFMRVSFAVDCGISAVDALDAMLERLQAPGLDLVVLALKVSQRTGAPLKNLLAEATQMVSARIELRRMLDVKTSQVRLSSRLVACMPVAMIALLSVISGDFRDGLATPVGTASVAMALALNVAALVIIRKIMDVRL